jgi:predicted ribosomally synthesized peptide with SipW-like signal peptide
MRAADAPVRRQRSNLHRVLLSVLAVGVIGAAAGFGTFAAFSSSTSNSANSFDAGTVAIADDDAGGTLVTLSTAKPGDSTTGCIKITYTGSLAANVHLYGTVTGALAPYLNLTVTRGTGAATFPGCGSFSADGTNYMGAGAGVVYSGLLSAYPSTYAAGTVDPNNCGSAPCGAQSWTNPSNHVYKFVITLANDNNAQGLSSNATFTWEARNT